MTMKRHAPGREPGAHQSESGNLILPGISKPCRPGRAYTMARQPEAPSAGHVIEPMLSIDDLAAILSCSRRLVERMRSSGKVPKPDFHVGRCPRWLASTIRRWIGEGASAR